MPFDFMSAIASRRFLGVPVEAHAEIGSTNDEVFRRASEGAAQGLVVVAETQTAGRGRQGRLWLDSPGQSLLFSVLLQPTIPLPSYPLLALALACSIAEAGSEAAGGALLDVKWPNDVLHQGKKLCGVLAESRALAPGAAPALVVGAGVNGNQLEADFPPEIRGRATSLCAAAKGARIDLAALFAGILDRYADYIALARGGDPRSLFERVRPWLPAEGARVRVTLGERAVEGLVESVTETGALRVRDHASGALETLAAGVME